jgi:hypothetical protein
MNVFQLIKTVLEEIYKRISGDDADKDEQIKSQMFALRKAYENLLREGVPNDYADAVTRFAYIYVYVTSHANVVYQLIQNCSASKSCSELASLFDRDQVNVTCIGGGPGSDFLGILKYIIKNEKTPRLKLNLFDREAAWHECWQDVDDKLKLPISNTFTPFDVTKEETWKPFEKFLSDDLFTMVYFMSEINSLREQAEPFFVNLFENAKSSALMLYVDNNNKQFYEWFDSLVVEHGWRVLMSNEGVLGMEDYAEEKRDLEPYYSRFQDPKLRANVAYRICQKQ